MSDEEIVRISDELAREQEEARAAARPSPWQPIATARGRKEPFFAYFRRFGMDQYSDWDNYVAFVGTGDHATHWMPLPAPPAQDGGRP